MATAQDIAFRQWEHEARRRRHAATNRGGMPQLHMATAQNMDPHEEGVRFYDDVFTYSVAFGNLVAGAVSAQNFQIQMDSQFEWMKSTFFASVHGATQPWSSSILYNLNIMIQDTGSGLQLMNIAVPVNSIAGTGQLPFIVPASRIFQPSGTVQVTLTNTDAAQQYDGCQFNFIGRKIFKGRPPGQG